MARVSIVLLGVALGACAPAAAPERIPDVERVEKPVAEAARIPEKLEFNSLEALQARWEVVRIDDLTFPAQQSFVHFQRDGFFTHEAGCGGGHPAFYEATTDGSLTTSRREPVIIAKCLNARAATLERALTDFVDDVRGWAMPTSSTLVLTAADGRTAELRLPVGPAPELEGDWRVVSIGGQAWAGPEPATIGISFNWLGAGAGCNGGGASWSSPASGRLQIGPFASTQMLCDEPLMAAEGNLFGAVARVTGYRVDGDSAVLTGPRDIVLVR